MSQGEHRARARHVAVAIPAYREAAGIAGFLAELDAALAQVADRVSLVVVDDDSTDDTVAVIEAAAPDLAADVVLRRAERNRGHGPTTMVAYRVALGTGADVVAQVDGDGQFPGDDLARVVAAAAATGRPALGVRGNRVDAWFRRALTRALRRALALTFGVDARDANCPLRAFPAVELAQLLDQVPADALVPNVHLSMLAHAREPEPVELVVRHLPRRSTDAASSMFGGGAVLIPRRLVAFCARAALETLGMAMVRWAQRGARGGAR